MGTPGAGFLGAGDPSDEAFVHAPGVHQDTSHLDIALLFLATACAVFAVAFTALTVFEAVRERRRQMTCQPNAVRIEEENPFDDWDRRMALIRSETTDTDDPALPVVLEQAASRGWDGDT